MSDITLDSFLVKLGFSIDGASERRFQQAAERARLAALAVTAALTGVVVAVAKVAGEYEQLYYQTQRVGSAAGNIQALRYAMAQLGGSAAGANNALESIGAFLRSSPNAEGFFTRLGVATRTANGGLRDTGDILHDFAQQLKGMPFYRAQAYANVLGIDPNTLMVLMRDTGQFERQLRGMYAAVGIDSTKASAASAHFMQQLRAIGATAQVLRDKVALSLEHGVGYSLDVMREGIVSHLSQAGDAIAGFIAWGMRLGFAIAQFGEQGIAWFESLDKGTRRWIEGIALLSAALVVLNRGFLASPVGRVMELVGAIGLLVQDYEGWKSGSKSLIDWAAWKPGIDAASSAITALKTLLKDFWGETKPFLTPIVDFFGHEFLDAFLTTGKVLGDLFRAMDDAVKGNWVAAGKDLHQALADTEASGREGQQAAAKLAGTENAASGGALAAAGNRLLDHSAMDDATGISGGDHVNWLTRQWRYLTGQTSRAEATGLTILRGLGLDRVHALAMLGNFEQESDLDPDARNGRHFGIEQWSDDRADYIKQATGIDVRTAGYADQLKAAVWEITGGREGRNARGFFGATDLSAAAGLFATDIERSREYPGMAGFDNRIANSHRADYRTRFMDGGAGSGSGKTINATTNASIVVNGAASPDATARAVLRHQTAATDATIRNMGPLIR